MEALRSVPAEQSVLLKNTSWETYERLIAERGEHPVPRFFYDRGVLEIMSLSTKHEEIGRLIGGLVRDLAVEWEINFFDAGSTTYKREDLVGGFEPDGSFYFGDAARHVRAELRRGKLTIDLDAGDPAPDLVVEVDITSPSLRKLPIYARLGVREVWRYAGGKLEILGLVAGEVGEELRYEPIAESFALSSPLTSEALARLVEEGLTTEDPPGWVREVREWARRTQGNPPESPAAENG